MVQNALLLVVAPCVCSLALRVAAAAAACLHAFASVRLELLVNKFIQELVVMCGVQPAEPSTRSSSFVLNSSERPLDDVAFAPQRRETGHAYGNGWEIASRACRAMRKQVCAYPRCTTVRTTHYLLEPLGRSATTCAESHKGEQQCDADGDDVSGDCAFDHCFLIDGLQHRRSRNNYRRSLHPYVARHVLLRDTREFEEALAEHDLLVQASPRHELHMMNVSARYRVHCERRPCRRVAGEASLVSAEPERAEQLQTRTTRFTERFRSRPPRRHSRGGLDFDSTLGFPGEGPGSGDGLSPHQPATSQGDVDGQRHHDTSGVVRPPSDNLFCPSRAHAVEGSGEFDGGGTPRNRRNSEPADTFDGEVAPTVPDAQTPDLPMRPLPHIDPFEDIRVESARQDCYVCLEQVDPGAEGADQCVQTDCCDRQFHLRCLAQLHCNTSGLCPHCRVPCLSGPSLETFSRLCGHLGLHRDVAERRDTRNAEFRERLPPPCDKLVQLSCCNRVACTLEAGSTVFEELPDRSMEWSPNFDRTACTWSPSWICMACNRVATPESQALHVDVEPPICQQHGRRTLSVDFATGRRSWICASLTGYDRLPVQDIGCDRTPLDQLPLEHLHHRRAGEDAAPQVLPHLFNGRPSCSWPAPTAQVTERSNSWFYTPLLLDACGFRTQADREMWTSHPISAGWWAVVTRELATARDMAAATLIARLEEAANIEYGFKNEVASLSARSGERLTLQQVVQTLADHRGYLQCRLKQLFCNCLLAGIWPAALTDDPTNSDDIPPRTVMLYRSLLRFPSLLVLQWRQVVMEGFATMPMREVMFLFKARTCKPERAGNKR